MYQKICILKILSWPDFKIIGDECTHKYVEKKHSPPMADFVSLGTPSRPMLKVSLRIGNRRALDNCRLFLFVRGGRSDPVLMKSYVFRCKKNLLASIETVA